MNFYDDTISWDGGKKLILVRNLILPSCQVIQNAAFLDFSIPLIEFWAQIILPFERFFNSHGTGLIINAKLCRDEFNEITKGVT